MEFLNQYEALKQGLEARKQTIKENIAAAKTTQTGIIDQVAAKKEEYRKTLNVELLNQIEGLENQLNDTSKKLNTLNDVLISLDLEKAEYNGDLNQEFKKYIEGTQLNTILEAIKDAKEEYISGLNMLVEEMEKIYNTSAETKKKANEILPGSIVAAISFNAPLSIGGLNEIIVTENKQDTIDINQARKHIKSLMTRI